jgi:hypothetical protein
MASGGRRAGFEFESAKLEVEIPENTALVPRELDLPAIVTTSAGQPTKLVLEALP